MSQQRILVVEDDTKLAAQIQRFLSQHHFQVELLHNGLSAVSVIQQDPPDVVILDLMLPGLDGLSVLREVRAQFDGDILILTANDDDMDHVAGIELGANNYLIKPIHPRVLLAHVKASLRKHRSAPPAESRNNKLLAFGQLTLHRSQRWVELAGKPISLSPSEFDVLLLLMSRPEQVVSRDDILQLLRGINYDGLDRSVDTKVAALRRKLDDNAKAPRRIITLRNKGYVFVADAWH